MKITLDSKELKVMLQEAAKAGAAQFAASMDLAEVPVPAKPAKTVKARKALTRKTRLAFIAQAAKEGYDIDGWSTWEIAYWCVSMDYAPQGFEIGARYTELAEEAGALNG